MKPGVDKMTRTILLFLVLRFAETISSQDCVQFDIEMIDGQVFGVPWLPEVQRRIKVTVNADEAIIFLSNQARAAEGVDDHYRLVLDATALGFGFGTDRSVVQLGTATVLPDYPQSINFLTAGTDVDLWIDVYTSPAGHQRIEVLDADDNDVLSWTNLEPANRVFIRYIGVQTYGANPAKFKFCDVLPILRSEGQPAIQSSTHAEYEASLAVDGDDDTDFTQYSCTLTTDSSENWWRVDLGAEYDIKMVILINRQDADPDKLLDAQVWIGSCPPENRNHNKLCDGPVTSTEVSDGIPILRSCSPNTYGQYVYVEGAQRTLTLCEVKVYGEIIPDGQTSKLFFSEATYSQIETQSFLTISVLRSTTYPTCASADISFTDDSATEDDDYSVLESSVFLGPDDEEDTIRLQLYDDELAESTEVLTAALIISSVVGASTGFRDSAEVRILDDDSVTYRFTQTTYAVKESVGEVVIEVTREGGTKNPGDIVLTKTLGTALPVSDYENIEVRLHFDADMTVQTGQIGIVDDVNLEVEKEFYVGIEVITSYGDVDPDYGRTTVIILDDDDEFYFERTAMEVPESQSVEVVVKRRGALELGSQFELMITADSADSGTDYTSENIVRLEFTPGSSTVTHSIFLVDDTFGEDDEQFQVLLRTDAGEVLEDKGLLIVTIKDDDARYTLETIYASVSELDRTVEIVVLRSGYVGIPTTARISTTFISAGNGDFTSLLYYPVTFNPGENRKAFTIIIQDDQEQEPLETFQVYIHDADGFVGTPSEALVTIIDNDGKVTLGSESYSVSETQPILNVELTRDGVLDNSASVRVLSSTVTATSLDYIAVDETIIFPKERRSAAVTIEIIPDDIPEDDEEFTLLLTSAVNVSLGDIKEARVTIVSGEDDGGPEIEAGPGVSRTVTITLSVSGGVVLLLTVTIAVCICIRMSRAPKKSPPLQSNYPNQVQTDPYTSQMSMFSDRFGVAFGNSAMQMYGSSPAVVQQQQLPALEMPTTYREFNSGMLLSNANQRSFMLNY